MSLRDYIEMRPDFTEDKNTDGSAPTAQKNSFYTMRNYIPRRGCIDTRKGISGFVHTPDTSGTAWNPEDYSSGETVTPPFLTAGDTDFAVIVGILNFETTIQTSIGYNALAPYDLLFQSASVSVNYGGKCTTNASVFKQGTRSLITTNNTAWASASGNPARTYGLRTYNSQNAPIWMPGHSSGVTAFMMTWWAYPLRAAGTANAEWHFCSGNRNDGFQSVMARHFDTQFQASFCSNSGPVSVNLSADSVKQDEWNFFGIWMDYTAQVWGAYKWNSDGEHYNVNSAAGTARYFYIHSSLNTINALNVWDAGAGAFICDNSDAFSGFFDYFTFWSKPMHINSSSNVTLCRLIKNLHA